MSHFDLCRVCFTHNIRMYPLHSTRYQELYEKHTRTKLIGESKFDKVCYLCNTLLLRYYKFLQMAQEAEKNLKETYHNGVELTASNVSPLSSKMHCLTVKVAHSLSLTDQSSDQPAKEMQPTSTVEDVAVKIESLDIEEELIEEDFNIDVEDLNIDIEDTNQDIIVEIPKKPEIKISDVRVSLERLPLPKLQSKRTVHCCQHCPRRFRSATLLRRHKCEGFPPVYLETLRHGPRQYICEMCDRHFNHRSMFLVHHRTHTGEKPFQCKICDKAFNDKSNCRKHMKTHLAPRNVCLMCNRNFAERKWLLRHVVEHIL